MVSRKPKWENRKVLPFRLFQFQLERHIAVGLDLAGQRIDRIQLGIGHDVTKDSTLQVHQRLQSEGVAEVNHCSQLASHRKKQGGNRLDSPNWVTHRIRESVFMQPPQEFG